MTHICPIASCSAKITGSFFMCARHWRMVPKPLQDAVYASYKTTGRISDNHREATRVVEAAEAGRLMPGITPGMKALTLWQPWASLIIIGAKPYEFRKWDFTEPRRPGVIKTVPSLARLVDQRVVIHAGARTPKKGELEDIIARIDEGESALIGDIARPFIQRVIAGTEQLPMSAALGTMRIGRPQKSFDLFKHIVADSDRLDHQMYAWPVSDVERFPAPIPAAGAQGFWNWS